MFAPLLAVALLSQQPTAQVTEAQITKAFETVFKSPPENKTIKGQLTFVISGTPEAKLIVINYRMTVGKTLSTYQCATQLKVGLETKKHTFLIASDGKNQTVYDQTTNVYSVTPISQSEPNPPIFIGLHHSIWLLNQHPKAAIPEINDPQAAQEALAILPTLFAQKGILSGGARQDPDGRYTIFATGKSEEMPAPAFFSLTLSRDRKYLERIRTEFHPDEKVNVTVTEQIESIVPNAQPPKFSLNIPKRAKKVKALPSLLDSVSSQG
jgi:outer membrane lipoprotein-sorting protein